MPEKGTDHTSYNRPLKREAIIALSLMAILLVFSLLFYKERMLFIDAPHNLFLIINDGHFHIEERRYGSFISQLLPLAGSTLHLPLQWLMILYSASFNLFFLTAGLLLVFKCKNHSLAILLALYLTLFVSATFYWPNNEVHQGMGWLLMAFAINFHAAEKKWPFFISLPLFAASFYLAIWTHPLILVVAVYMWLFFWLGNINWHYTKTQSAIYTGILLLLVGFKFNSVTHHGTDSTKIESVTHFKAGMWRSVIGSPQLHLFLRNCITNYWIPALLFVAGIAVLIKKRRVLLFLLTALFASSYLMLVCITFGGIGVSLFYMRESEYMPLSIMCSLPFIYFLLPELKWKTGVIMLALIFCVRLVYIYQAAPPFTNRVALLEKISRKMKEKSLTKVIITEPGSYTDSTLIMNWGVPVESILLSALQKNVPQRTFIFLDSDAIKTINTASRDTFLGCWEKRPVGKLNSYYFQMDTGNGYKVVSYSSLME